MILHCEIFIHVPIFEHQNIYRKYRCDQIIPYYQEETGSRHLSETNVHILKLAALGRLFVRTYLNNIHQKLDNHHLFL